MRWWGSTWDTEGVPVQAVLVGDVGGRPGEVGDEEAWHGRGLKDKDVVDPGDRRDGGPVGADSGVWVLVSAGATGVLPTRPVGPSV